MIPRDLHDFEDVAENYDLYLDAMYSSQDNHAASWPSTWTLPAGTARAA